MMLTALAPIMLLIAGLILLEGSGPVLFRQERYGRGLRIFVLYKFRTMSVCESSGSFTQATPFDPRVTRIGRFLRRTSLDELPQLFNVLRGDMSLVGPRPHAVAMDVAYAPLIPNYSERHLVRPGLTGLAQVSGYRGPTDATHKIRARLRCDRAYIRCWSIHLDIKILLRTPLALFGPNAL
jgi:putative colanic acid biosynthesis UDP-glucose lipid carrier transferase